MYVKGIGSVVFGGEEAQGVWVSWGVGLGI